MTATIEGVKVSGTPEEIAAVIIAIKSKLNVVPQSLLDKPTDSSKIRPIEPLRPYIIGDPVNPNVTWVGSLDSLTTRLSKYPTVNW
jgi:hypothetical protein